MRAQAIVMISLGLFIAGLCVPLAMGKIGVNRWYGVRIPASYASDKVWYQINHAGGWALIIGGICLSVVGLAALLLGFGGLWLQPGQRWPACWCRHSGRSGTHAVSAEVRVRDSGFSLTPGEGSLPFRNVAA